MTVGENLPAGLLAWVGEVTGGAVFGATRHTARREAWIIDVQTAGQSRRYFLRLDRVLAAGRGWARNLRRETGLIQWLSNAGFPTQKIVAWNDEFCAALQSFEPGQSDLSREPRPVQNRVLRHCMEIVAELHKLRPEAAHLPEFIMPTTPLEHSLLEVEAIEDTVLHPVSICETHTLSAFAKRWLINHAPPSVEETVLLQGDTGPANFLYDPEAARVTVVMDWEWAHFGDPLEDLGNIWVRDFFYPSSGGNLTEYFRYYAKLTGYTLNRGTIEYYKIHQLVRSVLGLAYLADDLDWQTPVSLNLGYRAVVDLQVCIAMMEASGLDPKAIEPAPDFHHSDDNALQLIVAKQVEAFILPRLDDKFARFVAEGHIEIARYLASRERFAAQIDADELQRLRALLRGDFENLDDARNALIANIGTLMPRDEEPVLRHLTHMAQIQAALMAPLMKPWKDARFATLDI
jgi:aminoglycoside phosphotransferase (APT) family kinase protein